MNFNIDLKSIDLKNISLEDIQAKLKNVEKKTWIKIGSVVGAVVLFLIIFYGVLNPIVEKKKAQLDDMNMKIEETNNFINNIQSAKTRIKKMRPTYEQYSTLFHSRAEVEGLYQTLSQFAADNNLVISKIEKKKIRVGGMVKNKSISVEMDKVKFIITDFKNEINVIYSGLIPNLFAEGKGVVAEGFLKDKSLFLATKILAKHDENYMPPEVKAALEEK